MREQQVTWEEICKITGLGLGPAYNAWKRYTEALKNRSEKSDGENREDRSAG